jgi:hypothetical protein
VIMSSQIETLPPHPSASGIARQIFSGVAGMSMSLTPSVGNNFREIMLGQCSVRTDTSLGMEDPIDENVQ